MAAQATPSERSEVCSPADVRDPEARAELGRLAVRLLDPSPARIACHVEHGREHETGADREHLVTDHVGDVADERGIPRARETERLREGGGAAVGEPADRLLRAASTGMPSRVLLDGDVLDLVDERRRVLGEQSGGRADPGDLADAVGQQLARRGVVERVVADELVDPDGAQLRDLLLERHPAEQVGDAFVDRRRRVPVRLGSHLTGWVMPGAARAGRRGCPPSPP